MASIFHDALPVLVEFASAFGRLTFGRAYLLIVAVFTTRRRTIANFLHTRGALVLGLAFTYHRILSPACCSAREGGFRSLCREKAG